jgi:hypothetical protein
MLRVSHLVVPAPCEKFNELARYDDDSAYFGPEGTHPPPKPPRETPLPTLANSTLRR